jgi:uncharacterized protein YbbC (DUF1343 family)
MDNLKTNKSPRNACWRVLVVSALLMTPAFGQVQAGIDVLLREHLPLIDGKRIGLITNPTGVTSDLASTIDALHAVKNAKLAALFGPEHGVRGDVLAGEKIAHSTDAKTGVPVYSLYGATRQPTPEMLKGIDVLIYDIQDIGSRAYTYIYTMALSMQAAAKAGIPFVVLDRPNPLGGNLIEGPVLDEKFKSFIGLYPIPYIYGMTVGELARYFNEEYKWGANLTVVPMRGWRRDMLFGDTGLSWVPTSPHVPHPETAFLVAATGGIGELQTVSEGVGYTLPFELIGQTWIKPDELAAALNDLSLPGVRFRPLHFRPYYFGLKDQQLAGVQIHLIDARTFQPMLTQLWILTALRLLYPKREIFAGLRIKNFDQAMGTDQVRLKLLAGERPEKTMANWKQELDAFKDRRAKYLLYQ